MRRWGSEMLYFPLPPQARRLHPDSRAYQALLDEARRGTPRHKRPIYVQRAHALQRLF